MTEQPWDWPIDRVRAEVNRVRAGRPFTGAWPNGATVAVAISFDSDHETAWLRDGDIRPGVLSHGEYGARRASPRILELLAEYEVPATFFYPAVAALLHPEDVAGICQEGHEIAVHGWIHERGSELMPDQERELLDRCLTELERMIGVRPTGIRTPSWDVSPHTLRTILDLGFAYDSSLMADDHPYEVLADGAPTGLIEIPVNWIRDDAVYFVMDRGSTLRPQISPADVLNVWLDEYDGARREGGLFQLTLHPDIIGHRSRMPILRTIIERIRADGDSWVATHHDVAHWVRTSML